MLKAVLSTSFVFEGKFCDSSETVGPRREAFCVVQ